ncbi:MAG: hypothetical protein L6R42_009943 [Xanthoria sp. 1 TBL-2021]|nr:MAG: hypothetical protein L6R42_009943 [Xanthoria sp. 1 TBL-2021]
MTTRLTYVSLELLPMIPLTFSLTCLFSSADETRKSRASGTVPRTGIHDEAHTDCDSYNTRSNKVRVIKTPGGKLQYQHLKKRGSPPKCGDCGIKLPGVCLDSIASTLPRPTSLRYTNLWDIALTGRCFSDSCSSTSRIRHYLTTKENGTTRLWWFKMCKLRERQGCTSVPDRRAEDCEEGAQGKPTEEEIGCRRQQEVLRTAMIATRIH